MEVFNPVFRTAPDTPEPDLETRFRAIQDLCATPNGVYGLKIFPRQFRPIAEVNWPGRLPNLSFLHLRRLDVVGQAISEARAQQTGAWTVGDPVTGVAAYDRDLITARLQSAVRQNTDWDYYFARNRIEPFRLTYEALLEQPDAAVGAIAQWLGVDLAAAPKGEASRTRSQRDALTEEWRSRFLREAGDLARFP